MASADLVLFAINSALKLSAAARAQYVASTQSRPLTFPLPDVDFSPDTLSAINWFRGAGAKYQSESRTLLALKSTLASNASSIDISRQLDDDTSKTLMANYDVYFKMSLLERGVRLGEKADIDNASMLSLLQIRQWRDGESPHPSLLKRIAGNLIDTAVDYFVRVPGALNTNSKHAKAIKALVSGLDKIEFTDALTPQNSGNLPQQLLLATLETVSEQASEIVSDPRYQNLIELTAQSLSTDLSKYFATVAQAGGEVPIDQQKRAGDWAELVFRSVLGSAGKAVVDNPAFFLKQTKAPQQALTSQVGSAVLDAILSSPQGELDKAFNSAALQSVIKASVSVISQHPSLLVKDDQKALTVIVQQVSAELAGFTEPLGADLIPKTIELILQKTADNVELFWLDENGNPKPNPLIQVAKTVIATLQVLPEGATWRIQFTRPSVDQLIDWTMQAVVDNPAWLLDKAGDVNSNLEVALSAMLGSLRKLDDIRFSSQNAVALIEVGLKAVMLNQDFVKKRDQDQQVVIAAIFDVVLDSFFGHGVSPAQRQFVHFQLVSFFMDELLQEIAKIEGKTLDLVVMANQIKAMLTEFRNLDQPRIKVLVVQIVAATLAD